MMDVWIPKPCPPRVGPATFLAFLGSILGTKLEGAASFSSCATQFICAVECTACVVRPP